MEQLLKSWAARLNPRVLIHQIFQVVRAFPVTVALAVAMAYLLTGVINDWSWVEYFWAGPDSDAENSEDWMWGPIRWVLFMGLGLPLYVAAELGAGRLPWGSKNRWAANELAAGVHAFVIITAPNREDLLTGIFPLWFFPTVVFTHVLVALVPFLGRPQAARAFWFTNQSLFLGFAQSAIFSAILYAGISGVLGALHLLFDLELEPEYFGTLAAWVYIPVQTFIFLSNIPNPYTAEDQWPEPPKALWNLLRFIVWPILGVYALILVAYGLKITAQWELPRGVVTGLIGGFGGIGYLAVALSREYAPARPWALWFQRILLLLLVLLWVALGKRVLDYGFTELRVFGFYHGLFLTVLTVLYVVRPKAPLHWVPVVLAIAALAISVGPFSASQWAFKSQYARFLNVARENNLLDGNRLIAAPKDLDSTARATVYEAAVYLAQNHAQKLQGTPLDVLEADSREWQARDDMQDFLETLNYRAEGTNAEAVLPTPQFTWESTSRTVLSDEYGRVEWVELYYSDLDEMNQAHRETGALWRASFGSGNGTSPSIELPVDQWLAMEKIVADKDVTEESQKRRLRPLPTSNPEVFFLVVELRGFKNSDDQLHLETLEGYLVQKRPAGKTKTVLKAAVK
jgi:hypothetical protein